MGMFKVRVAEVLEETSNIKSFRLGVRMGHRSVPTRPAPTSTSSARQP